jgi:hypothetical protein
MLKSEGRRKEEGARREEMSVRISVSAEFHLEKHIRILVMHSKW